MENQQKIHKSQVAIRQLETADLNRAMLLKDQAGWNQLKTDWEIFLNLNKNGCFVAERDDLVIGTATTLVYDKTGWIAMVLVDRNFRRMKIGSMLFNRAMEHLSGCICIKLDATPEGRLLYLKSDFSDEFEIVRLCASARESKIQSKTEIMRIEKSDLNEIAEYDRNAFGSQRKDLIEILFSNNEDHAFKAVQNNKISGFVLGRRGSKFNQIGPLVNDQPKTAFALMNACMQNTNDKQFILDVPRYQKKWLRTLLDNNFEEQRSFSRMYKGRLIKGNDAAVFATTGPDLG